MIKGAGESYLIWGVRMVIDELIEQAKNRSRGRKVKDVRAGLGYTCVMLEDSACGLAYTFRNAMGHCCGVIPDAGTLVGRDSGELISWAKEGHMLKSAIGLATINAILNNPSAAFPSGNVIQAFDVKPSETFGMIGEFSPILFRVKEMTGNIYVFEQEVVEGDGLYPSSQIPELLPSCNVVVITATSIINHSIDGILPYCKNARQVCITGPSTPICPEVFQKYNVTMLAGSVVEKPDLVLQFVSQGGGTMNMKPAIRHVLVPV